LHFLGSRYAEAAGQLDEIRTRALELVVAACVAEAHPATPGEMPPPGPAVTGLTDQDLAPPLVAEETPWWRSEAAPVREPEPLPEPGAPGDGTRPPESGEPWSGAPPAPSEEPPPEPVRGAWEPPSR
jgi:hypothetical protein